MNHLLNRLSSLDPELVSSLAKEEVRQEEYLELIASENYASKAVMEAQGSLLTNKYAEGLPHKRYYGGCEHVDAIEVLALERAKKLFKADFANVQPHSGSQANAAVLYALLKPGDTILGMKLSEGGHLTHGSPASFSGKHFTVVSYGIDPVSERIDYDQLAALADEHKPKLIIAGYSAYSMQLDFVKFREIADGCGAYLMVDMAHFAGLVAAGLHPSPLPYADVVTSTTHKTLRGPRGGIILAKANRELEKKVNSMVFPGTQGGPLMHVIAAKAVAFLEALQPSFVDYQKQVLKNADAMATTFIKRGYHVVSGGTENHLFLLSLLNRELSGKDAEQLLEEVHITTNKNTVPGETRSPFVTSGLRIGTPAITTRGMDEDDCCLLAACMADVLDEPSSQTVKREGACYGSAVL